VKVSSSLAGNVIINQVTPDSYPTSYSFGNGDKVTLEAVPAEGYFFTGWSGSLSGSVNPASLTMDCVKDVTANFNQRPEHSIILQVDGQGTTNPAAGYHRYTEGTRVTITAIPDKGWRFDGWTGNIFDIKALSNTVIANVDTVYTARFSRILHIGWLLGSGAGAIVIIALGIWISARKRLLPG
jgi:hypothetical protein